MATKSEINLFINSERNKAIVAIEKKYHQMIKDKKVEIFTERGFARRAMALQAKINELHTAVASLENDMNHDDILGLNTYQMLANKMYRFIGESGYAEKLVDEANYDSTNIPLIKGEYHRTIKETNVNYDNLVHAIKQMKADKAMEHLKSLGFDITPLENKTTETALLALVDKTKLFYPRKIEETPQEVPAIESQEESGE